MSRMQQLIEGKQVKLITKKDYDDISRYIREAKTYLTFIVPMPTDKSIQFHNYLDESLLRIRTILASYNDD